MRKVIGAVLIGMLLFGAVLAQDAPDPKGQGADKPKSTEAGDGKNAEGEHADNEAEAGIQFLHDLEAAKKQAVEAKKKLFIVFSTSWCGPCKLLKQKVWSSDVIARRVDKDFVPVYLDGDKEAAAKKLFDVKAYPTIILAENDCKLIAREVGTGGKLTPEAWSMWIDDKLGQTGKLDALLSAVEKDPKDASALRGLADAYYSLGRKEDAAVFYGKAEELVEEELIQIKLKKCEILMAKLKDDPTVREVLDEWIPKLLRKKDERVIQISFDFANIIARMADEKDPKTARQMMLDLKEAFPDSDRMIEFRCHAGMYAHQAGDNDTALAEMKQIAEDYKDSDDKVIKIWVDRCGRFIKTVEGGGRYR
ncbi:MAG: thioredoxin family protein [Planctomycetes bacterium]|nr:thioredoxin family protein [Planctomycetota bacterium]